MREQRKKDGKSLLYIHQAIHERILLGVATTIYVEKEWDTLKTTYQGLDKVKTSKLQILIIYSEYLSMKDSETVDTF